MILQMLPAQRKETQTIAQRTDATFWRGFTPYFWHIKPEQ